MKVIKYHRFTTTTRHRYDPVVCAVVGGRPFGQAIKRPNGRQSLKISS